MAIFNSYVKLPEGNEWGDLNQVHVDTAWHAKHREAGLL